MIEGKTIFFAALDWGLGHTTRSAPLLRQLSQKNKVIVGVTGENRFFYRLHFPEHETVELPSYGVRYSRRLPAWLKLLVDSPRFWLVIQRERQLLSNWIEKHNIGIIVSDSRYGLYRSDISSILITHQASLQVPCFRALFQWINRRWMGRFTEIWIPDHQDRDKRLSGSLGEPPEGLKVRYIGPQSFLTCFAQESTDAREKDIDLLILISGVEPQRTMLETLLLSRQDLPINTVVVRGTNKSLHYTGPLKLFSMVTGPDLLKLLLRSKKIVCRSGYSTLMDLYCTGVKDVLLIPTPGQTEQEYLATHWRDHFGAGMVWQQNLLSEENIF